ncbi:MAG: hypothetical protein M3N46_08830 [Actinomycetota bacterium]|nr:hypothetical protein [Actinomycetota bacterium]
MRKLGELLRSEHGPVVVHVALLLIGFVALAAVASREWFFFDDWYFLVKDPGVVWAPHVGHWNTVPALILRATQSIFGMSNYLPFALPAILVHLGAAHFVWRISVRIGVRPWLATAFTGLLVFLGAGAEAIDWAVQIGFVGAITGLLAVILLLDREKVGFGRIVSASALVLLSLASSEVCLPFIPVAMVIALLRHGLRTTAAIFTVPCAAFLAWFVFIGHTDPNLDRAHNLGQVLLVPQYAVTMLSDGLGRMFPITVLGGLVFVAVGVWWLFSVRATFRSPAPSARVAYLLFLAAPTFALLTGYSRIGGGMNTATSSRYVYVIVVAIAPLLGLGFDRLTRRAPVTPAFVLVLILTLWNIGGLAIALDTRIQRADSTRVELAQVAALLATRPDCLPSNARPSPQWAAVVQVVDLEYWIARDWYHPAPVAPSPLPCAH